MSEASPGKRAQRPSRPPRTAKAPPDARGAEPPGQPEDNAAVLELLYARSRRHQVYNLAAGFMWSIADFCGQLQQVCSGFEWRFAQPGEQANIDYYAPHDRSAMAIERLRSDTAFLPRYNLAEALSDYLQWLGPAFKVGARS